MFENIGYKRAWVHPAVCQSPFDLCKDCQATLPFCVCTREKLLEGLMALRVGGIEVKRENVEVVIPIFKQSVNREGGMKISQCFLKQKMKKITNDFSHHVRSLALRPCGGEWRLFDSFGMPEYNYFSFLF